MQDTQAVTSADIESGVTGVGESTIDEKVVTHVQEQQMENAINNGVGVASILSTASEQEEEQVSSVEEAGSLVVYNEEGGTVIVASSVERMIVEPVELKETEPVGEEEADVPEKDEEQDEIAAPGEEKKEEAVESADTEKKETSAAQEKENKEKNEKKEEKETEEEKQAEEEKESEEEIETEEKKEDNREDVKDGQVSEETDVPAKETTDTEEESDTAVQETESKPAETQDVPVAEPVVQEQEVPVSAAEESVEAPVSEPAAQGSPATGSVEVVPASSGAGNAVVDYALQFVGNPYSYGGSSLTNGTDCSGFVMSVYKNFGVSLPHSSSGDRKVGSEVGGGLANAQPGDIVCYSGHVGIYIGDNKIVHASTESTGIKVSDADYKTPITVRRVIN